MNKSELVDDEITTVSKFSDHLVSNIDFDKESKEIAKQENENKRPKRDKVEIPGDFYYDYNEMVSLPKVSEQSGLPSNVIQFIHSFGYDSRKRDNLALLDKSILCFIAGNYLQFVDLSDMSHHYLRSLFGGGLGCLTVHPTKKFIAIGEKCSIESPVIAIYEYPSLRLYRLLKGGTERAYTYCQFNTTGELLASVGSYPDYMLTLWDWINEQTLLRSKAFSQDVHRVLWSNELEGVLTTGGIGHIRFWKIAETFTGLKLKGNIGKFGKTEISDIEGFGILPDGKVLSGCDFGNMLVWDGDLIKVQIGLKNKKSCHNGQISQIIIEEGEVMTVGIDGKINTWDFETIDTAEVAEEMTIFEMRPMNELLVSADAKLIHIVKCFDTESSIWYGQDSNGRIWKLDLSFSNTSTAPEVIDVFHSGEIRDCGTSPLLYISASTGADGSVRVYDFVAKKLLADCKYNSEGSTLLWAPLTMDQKGKTIFVGFHDGVIRILKITEPLDLDNSRKSKDIANLTIAKTMKPHTKRITCLCTNNKGDILVTGSDDETVFFFSMSSPELFPLGYVKVKKPVLYIEWKDITSNNKCENYLVVFMDEGEVTEVICPDPNNINNGKTFELLEILPINTYKFVSIKSRLRHEEELEKKRIEDEENERILTKLRLTRLENGEETEEEQQQQMDEEQARKEKELLNDEEWVPFIPETMSPICYGFIDKIDSKKFWLSMGGYDAGYLYQCEFANQDKQNQFLVPELYNEPLSSPSVYDSGDVPVTCMAWSQSGTRILMGFENGSIRLQNLNIPFDLNAMSSSWQYSMHDNSYGVVTSLCLSYDEQFIISVGQDGNYFVYKLMDEYLQEKEIEEYRIRLPSATIDFVIEDVEDINDRDAYSIEENKLFYERNKFIRHAVEKKTIILEKIQNLRRQFRYLKEENDKLPERVKLDPKVFQLVPELDKDLIKLRDEEIQLIRSQMAFGSEKHRIAFEKLYKRFREPLESDHITLYAIESDHTLSTIRGSHLSDEYFRVLKELESADTEKLSKYFCKSNTLEKNISIVGNVNENTNIDDGLAKCNLKGSRGMRITSQLKKLENNLKKRMLRKKQWDDLYDEKPADNYDDPQDIEAILEAKNKMGDFKLKTADDFFVDETERINAYKARSELLAVIKTTFDLRSNFNRKVLALRDVKLEIIRSIEATNNQIVIFNQVFQNRQKRVLINEIIHRPEEFPEKKFEFTKKELLEFKIELEERKKLFNQNENLREPSFKNVLELPLKKFGKMSRPKPVQQSTVSVDLIVSTSDPYLDLSNLQIEKIMIQEMKITHCTDSMIHNTFKDIRKFDINLKLLRHEQYKLIIFLRRSELHQLTRFNEYRFLKKYEKSEQGLTLKVNEKTMEKMDILFKISETQIKIDCSKREIDRLQERLRNNFEKFKESIPDNNKFADYLLKVYKKKIKRRKKLLGADDDSESESSDSDNSDLDDLDKESEESEVVLDLDICPPGCSQDLYDITCKLREIHLDIDEVFTEEKKNMEILKKEQDMFTKKVKIVESALFEVGKEIQAFQLEKQHQINQLNALVILKLHQILFHDNGQLPANMNSSLVFEASNYRVLKARIKRLNDAEIEAFDNGKCLDLQNIKFKQNKMLIQKKIEDIRIESDNMMTTKFGKLVNLEKMEEVMINPKIEELTLKMLELQDDLYCERSEWEDRICDAQTLYLESVKTYTCILDNNLRLFNDREHLSRKLESEQIDMGGEFRISVAEYDILQLNNLVYTQRKEIVALMLEIKNLKNKRDPILS